jgi:hypothetical protein
MDIIQYQKSRDAESALFQKEYDLLKVKYLSTLSAAAYEQDPQKQSQLVQQVLQINAELASEVRAFIAKTSNKQGYDESILTQISDDLTKYQNEYSEIKSSSDMVVTLQKILDGNTKKLEKVRAEYNIYLILLVLGIIILLYLIFQTPAESVLSTVTLGGALFRPFRRS